MRCSRAPNSAARAAGLRGEPRRNVEEVFHLSKQRAKCWRREGDGAMHIMPRSLMRLKPPCAVQSGLLPPLRMICR